MQKKKLIIFGDPKRLHASEAVERFIQFAEGKAEIIANCFKGSCSVDVLKKADFALVFGGDGTILSAARDLGEADVPVIGINVGKLGFLAEFSISELEELFDRIMEGEFGVEKRMILCCSAVRDGREIFHSTAINDMVIAAGSPFNMIELKIAVQGDSLTGCTSDGVIISTPTGSTAYNLSAGGPILSAGLNAVVISPLCPHTLSFRPIVISADSEVEVQMIRGNEGTSLILDGQVSHKLLASDVVKLKKHQGSFLVVNNPLRTKWDTLAGKLSWAEKPKYRKEK